MAQRKTKKKTTRKAGTGLYLVNASKNIGYAGLRRMGTVFSAPPDDVAHLVEQEQITAVADFNEARKVYRAQATALFRKEFNLPSSHHLDYDASVGKQYGDVVGGPDAQEAAPDADAADDEG